jgi:hypothetical protein
METQNSQPSGNEIQKHQGHEKDWLQNIPPQMAAQTIVDFHQQQQTLVEPENSRELEVEFVSDRLPVHLSTPEVL